MRYAAVALLAVALAGCQTAQKGLEIGTDVYTSIEARKAAEQATKEAERVAAEKAEADRIAAEKAEEERKDAEHKRREAEINAIPHGPERRQATIDAMAAYWAAGTIPRIVAPDNPAWGGTLWKHINHGMDGSVLLLDAGYMPHYEAGALASVDLCADPQGLQVIAKGRIVAPYHERPAVRFGKLGYHYRPGPVLIVMRMKNGVIGGVWYVTDPGRRIERGTK
jgi:hypothetical protein